MSRERHRVTWLRERGRTLLQEEEAVLSGREGVYTQLRGEELDEASGLVAVELPLVVV